MWFTKISSILFAGILLYPVARTFYEMCIFERNEEAEERPNEWPQPESDDGASTTFGVMLSQTYYAVAPFERLHRILGFGPRKWVGFLGFSATALVMALLIYSALFPLKGAAHSYEWREDSSNYISDDDSAGAMITWDDDDVEVPIVAPKSDEQGDDAN